MILLKKKKLMSFLAQILLAAPYGISSKSFPRGLILAYFSLKKLSGVKFNRLSHTLGSLRIAQMLTLGYCLECNCFFKCFLFRNISK